MDPDTPTPRHPDIPWTTVRPLCTVLAITRNVASTTRLLEVLQVFDSDPRVQIVAAVAPGSRFEAGTAELLATAGLRTLSWKTATSSRFDLAIAATHRGDLHRVQAPLILLPHGAGHNRHILTNDGAADPLAAPPGVQPLALAVAGEEQRRRAGPGSDLTVVGDPCFDGLLASGHLRAAYREALRVGDRQLILLTSTWRDGSLFGRHARLPADLLAQLPIDEYAVAAVLHPNIWALHSAYQLGTWLGDARRAGLAVLSPDDGWQAGLVAADLVIGDHGSVTMYAAALGKPLLLASFANDEVVPTSPAAALGEAAGRLVVDRPLRSQLAGAQIHVEAVSDMISLPGEGLTRIRRLCYDALGLAGPPGWIGPRAVDLPRYAFAAERVLAHQVFTRVGTDNVVLMERFPAELASLWRASPSDLPHRHLAVDARGRRGDLLDLAEVTVGAPTGRLRATACADGCVVSAASGERWRLSARGVDPLLLASAAYAQLQAMETVRGGRIRLGNRELEFAADPLS